METLIIIGVIIILIWLYITDSSSSTNYSSNTIPTVKTYTPIVYPKSIPKVSSVSKTITVSPKKIKSNPDLKISLIDGQYRYFENHYVNGKQYSFGFPKENCPDKRVWIGIGKEEIERISYSEAMRRIGKKNYISNQIKLIGTNNYKVGYCNICTKKLRGDIYKNKCYECYTKGIKKGQKIGYCANCDKKLRGNIHKKHCTECYYNGYR
jgi:hypothetical protein